MIQNLSRRERTVVVVGLALAVVIGGWSFVAAPVLDRNRPATELVRVRERLLEKRRDLVAHKTAIVAELAATRTRVDALSARLLTSTTPAVAASELQKLVKELAVAAKTEVRSERILPTIERGELVEVPVEIAVSGEIRDLVDLLARLDAAPKLVLVEEARIRVVNMLQPRELLATLTLSGFILPVRAKT